MSKIYNVNVEEERIAMIDCLARDCEILSEKFLKLSKQMRNKRKVDKNLLIGAYTTFNRLRKYKAKNEFLDSIITSEFSLLDYAQDLKRIRDMEIRDKRWGKWHTDPNDLPPMIQDERHISERVWINVEN